MSDVDEAPEPACDAGGDPRVAWWIKTLVASAAELRDAGVSSLAIGEFSATLLPKPAPPPSFDPIAKADEQLPDGIDALNDPRSYPGGVVPGFRIDKLTAFEE